jgi:hypothetical protein
VRPRRRWIAGVLGWALCSSAPAQNCAPFWAGVAHPGPGGLITSLRPFDDGSGLALYGTGDFSYTAGWYGVARWNGQNWRFLHEGWPVPAPSLDCNYASLFLLDFGQGSRLCAFLRQNPGCTRDLRIWTGTQWVEAPPGLMLVHPHDAANMLPVVSVNERSGPKIYGIRSDWPEGWNTIVRWNGTGWDPVGVCEFGEAALLAEFDDGDGPMLYVAGRFSSIAGVPAANIARWTGSQWQALGAGICAWHVPRHMIGHDDGSGPKLYVSDVVCAGGQPVNRIAKWNPATGQWSDVGGGGINTVGITEVYRLASFDDGRGPALYAGGYISMAGGVPVHLLARFNGVQWDDVMGGVGGGTPEDFAVFDDGRGPSLFVAGYFNRVGAGAPGSVRGIGQWVGCQAQCYANCDNSQTPPRLNVLDFSCFLNRYARGDALADCNQDRAINIGDFSCFLQRFGAGCP